MAEENKVKLRCSPASFVTSITHTGTVVLPSGVESLGVTATPNENGTEWLINIRTTDRTGSEAVALSFNGLFGSNPALHEYAEKIIDSVPGKLNLYAGFVMTTSTGHSYEIYLGQGHHGGVNNWWMGSMKLKNIPTAMKTLEDGVGEKKETIDVNANSNEVFTLTRMP